jgi:hypothetical protein
MDENEMNTENRSAKSEGAERGGAELLNRGVRRKLDWNGAGVTAHPAVIIAECQFLLRGGDFLSKAGQFVRVWQRRLQGLIQCIAKRIEGKHGAIGPGRIAARLHGITGGSVAPFHAPPAKEDSTGESGPCCKQGEHENSGYPHRFLHGGMMA